MQQQQRYWKRCHQQPSLPLLLLSPLCINTDCFDAEKEIRPYHHEKIRYKAMLHYHHSLQAGEREMKTREYAIKKEGRGCFIKGPNGVRCCCMPRVAIKSSSSPSISFSLARHFKKGKKRKKFFDAHRACNLCSNKKKKLREQHNC